MPKDDLDLEDILAEIETKRKTDGPKKTESRAEFSIEDILGETLNPAPRKRSAAEEKLAQRRAERKAKEAAEAAAEYLRNITVGG